MSAGVSALWTPPVRKRNKVQTFELEVSNCCEFKSLKNKLIPALWLLGELDLMVHMKKLRTTVCFSAKLNRQSFCVHECRKNDFQQD